MKDCLVKHFLGQLKSKYAAVAAAVVLCAVVAALVVVAGFLPHVAPQAPENPDGDWKAAPMLVSSKEDGKAKGDGSQKNDEERLDDTEELAKQATQDANRTNDNQQKEDDDGASTKGDGGNGGTGGNGDGGGGPGGKGDGDPSGKEDPNPANIITDLETRTVVESELDDQGLFHFYAYLSNNDYNLVVKFRNDATSTNGDVLTSENGRDYAIAPQLGENFVVLYMKRGDETVQRVVYMLTYMANTADEDHPERGKNPPTITTNLDGSSCVVKNQNFILRVKARTYKGDVIYSNHITAKADGKVLTKPTGTSTFEYDVHFDPPKRGDSENHKITVLAWDDEGNSRFVGYNVQYQFVAEGDKIGEMTIRIDMTTLGLGITDEFTCDILQGKTLPHTIMAGLEDAGYEVQHGGTLDNGFYLSRLSRAGMARGAHVPDILWANIQKDGLNLTGKKSRDSVGEFDYTQGSGWMYCINGTAYPGRSMTAYYPDDGDVISLRFTLAYGKDIGSPDSSGVYGDLAHYCGTWVEGGYTENHSFGEKKTTRQPTCEEEGEETISCPACGTKKTTPIPAKGHDWEKTAQVDATATQAGYIEYTCKHCGKTKRDIIPAKGGDDPKPTPDPGPKPDPEPDPDPKDPNSKDPDDSENPKKTGDGGK